MDVAAVVADINNHLIMHSFRPRDADGNDFQYGDDPRLRFKTGTSYKEVRITVWKNNLQGKYPITINSIEQVAEAKHDIDRLIREFFEYNSGVTFTDCTDVCDGDGEVIATYPAEADVPAPDEDLRWTV